MKRVITVTTALGIALTTCLIAGGHRSTIYGGTDPGAVSRSTNPAETTSPAAHPRDVDDRARESPESTEPAQSFALRRLTVNCGGTGETAASNYRLKLSVSQVAAARISGSRYSIGLGMWYDGAACPVSLTGDLNQSGDYSPADIVYSVNYLFKAGPDPLPCAASADVNCSGGISPADIIYLVNYVFKGGPEPCNVCDLIPGTWTCP